MALFKFFIAFLAIFITISGHAYTAEDVNLLTDFSENKSDMFSAYSPKFQTISRLKRDAMVVNEIADPILDDFRKKLIEKNANIVPVSNLTKSLSFSILGKNVNYLTFKGYNGRIKDISTIYRIGDVSLNKDENGIKVSFRFGFWTLEYSCDSYLMRFTWLKFSGALKVTIEESEVLFEATVNKKNSECRFEVNNMQVVKLDGIKVKMTGFSVLDKLMNLVVEKVLKVFKETIKKSVEKELVNGLTKAIEKTGVCKREESHAQQTAI